MENPESLELLEMAYDAHASGTVWCFWKVIMFLIMLFDLISLIESEKFNFKTLFVITSLFVVFI